MSITLDGVALSGSMLWPDRHQHSEVAQSTRRTLGGGLVVYTQQLFAGRPITLVAAEDTGWITKAMLDALETRAAVPGGAYVLNYHGFVVDVVFRHNDAPAVEFQPLQPKASPQAGDYYTGSLKLLTI